MHAKPEKKTGKTKKRSDKTRGQLLGDAALLPPNSAPYITDLLLEIGPLSPEGNALGWRDFSAWQDITGVTLEPWEARLIRRLSAEFGSMRLLAEKDECPPPYTGTEQDILSNRDRVALKVRAMFGGRKGH